MAWDLCDGSVLELTEGGSSTVPTRYTHAYWVQVRATARPPPPPATTPLRLSTLPRPPPTRYACRCVAALPLPAAGCVADAFTILGKMRLASHLRKPPLPPLYHWTLPCPPPHTFIPATRSPPRRTRHQPSMHTHPPHCGRSHHQRSLHTHPPHCGRSHHQPLPHTHTPHATHTCNPFSVHSGGRTGVAGALYSAETTTSAPPCKTPTFRCTMPADHMSLSTCHSPRVTPHVSLPTCHSPLTLHISLSTCHSPLTLHISLSTHSPHITLHVSLSSTCRSCTDVTPLVCYSWASTVTVTEISVAAATRSRWAAGSCWW